ncbi:MAG TPA: phosphoserine transaminase [Hyphomicrobiaceae bacterium]|jgi:phosphoserine aminotransferase|nr:phosphoserine transaminase [Hyphomicrobiaceae bacterium]
MASSKPAQRPANLNFSSGPCAKRPGWSLKTLDNAFLGRSHRAKEGKVRLKRAIEETKALLGLPPGYLCAIVPASDTGAFEMAMWTMLGERGVDALAWESFGEGWVTDVSKQLKLKDLRILRGEYGRLPDLGQVDFTRDVLFTWNGTTSGVRVPNGDWIAANRTGLTFADATSAVFAQTIPWDKVDVASFSWQKALGSEAAHGMLILSPRAIERLEGYTPPWPLPKVFRLTKGGKLMAPVFDGETINTPSMLCVEDYLDALAWANSIGGLSGLQARADANAKVLYDWAAKTPWLEPLAADPATRSNTSVCLKVVDPSVVNLPIDAQRAFVKQIEAILDKENAAHDIAGHRDAPPHLRIWCGCTIEATDLQILTGWLDWAFAEAKAGLAKAA